MVFADELPPVPRSRLSIWTWRIFKIVMLIGLLFFIAVAVLTRIGGNNDNLRMGLESVIGRTAGDYPARVGILHALAFFPYIRVYAEHIEIMPHPVAPPAAEGDSKVEEGAAKVEKEEEKKDIALAPPLMTIGTLMFSRGFWDSFFWKNRIEGIRMEGINTAPGYISPRAISNGFISVGEDVYEGKPGGEFSGKYGKHDFKLLVTLERKLVNLRPTYSLPKESLFTLTFGPLSTHGKMTKGKGGGIAFSFEALTMKPAGSAARILPLHGLFEIRHGFSARNFYLTVNNKDNQVKLGMEEDNDGERDITVTATRLVLEDIGPLLSFASEILDLYEEDAPGIALDGPYAFGVTVKELYNGTVNLGDVNLRGTVNDKDALGTTEFAGTIAGGKLSGTVTLDALPQAAQLSMNMRVDDFDYSRVRAQASPVKGTADAHIKLTAEGASFKNLHRNLSGEIIVLGGQGHMTSGAINVWGNGLLNTMLPDLSASDALTVNCLMMRFDVKNSVATANPFLLDTTGVTVKGEGTVDLYNEQLDMLFTPQAKGVSIGDVSTAVRVDGPWRKPDVGPDGFSLGKKLGGLLLGTINPALWAWSLTDIGVSDNHPCRPYLEGRKAE